MWFGSFLWKWFAAGEKNLNQVARELKNSIINNNIEPGIGTFGNVRMWKVLLKDITNISIKLVRRGKHADFRLNKNTVIQHQQIKWLLKSSTVETSYRISNNSESVPLQSSFRLLDLDFQTKYKVYFHHKRSPWTTEQQLRPFSASPR